ncbi:precorrin-6y C5,15-methyltransferase (decarboxylating) subunit CbiE [Vibrio intestinalis]|uniref:precorrin-6y C5,15-methyltransferase (decarboxylating) subunit CbiE n=1 Tax=Vibrio intestinalis TaxID=2933291 RepID=UPI0021A79124|nr:precorrin-6y C5,15-methyltransferase (decarboxylating) subunit CbiE [Vibrio intestinalis]
MSQLTVIGVAEDGCLSLTSKAVNSVASAEVLAGHARHKVWFPQFRGEFLDMSMGFNAWLSAIESRLDDGLQVVVLASGDPLFFGIGAMLNKRLSLKARVIPSLSSMQLACAELGWPWQEASFISLHGRERFGLTARLQSTELCALLTDGVNTPVSIAQHLLEFNQLDWQVAVCEQLGSTQQRVRCYSVEQLAQLNASEFDTLNIVMLKRGTQERWGGFGIFSHDDDFAKKVPKRGLISKFAVRNQSVAWLRLGQSDTFWDIGSGSGSVAIELAKQAHHGEGWAIESEQECIEVIEQNLRSHSVDNVKIVHGKAPEFLHSFSRPNGVFIGGSRGEMSAILSTSWEALLDKGRIVVSAVTLETQQQVQQWAEQNQLQYQLQVINISNAQPLAGYQRLQADNPVYLYVFNKNN